METGFSIFKTHLPWKLRQNKAARVMGVLERELHGARAKLTDTSTRNNMCREGDQGQTPGARELPSLHACSKHRRFHG